MWTEYTRTNGVVECWVKELNPHLSASLCHVPMQGWLLEIQISDPAIEPYDIAGLDTIPDQPDITQVFTMADAILKEWLTIKEDREISQ